MRATPRDTTRAGHNAIAYTLVWEYPGHPAESKRCSGVGVSINADPTVLGESAAI